MTGQFDVRDLHRPLDVFTRDEVFLGSIVKVVPADGPTGDLGTTMEQVRAGRAAAEPRQR